MKWIERLTDCVDYIEENLTGEIDANVLCDKACLSHLYFSRLFEAVTDISLSEYVRRRKMTLAVRELMSGERKVIDVALDYGYSSPEAFSRAFKSVHGISPSRVKDQKKVLKSYHRLTFSISIKGDTEMNYRVEEKEAFQVLGKSLKTTSEDNKNFTEIPLFWQKINTDGTSEKMGELSSDPGKVFGICFDEKQDKTFRYAAAVPYEGGEKGPFDVMDIPGGNWAVFESIGPMPDAIQKVWHRIFAEWLPATGYEIAPLPQIEFYSPGDCHSEEYRCEVWLPIIK